MMEHWSTGLDEQTPPERLENARWEAWQEWHSLHDRNPWQKETERLEWVKKRLNWIGALQQRLRSERNLQMARGGLVTSEFVLGSVEDPFGEP